MRGSHTSLLPLQALSQPSNMGSRTIGACSQVFRFKFFKYTTITVAHSAYFSNVPLFPRPYTTTYLSRMLRLSRNRNPISWVIQIRKLPRASSCIHGLVTVSFQPSALRSLSMPFRGGHSRYGYPGDTIHHVTLFLPTYRDCTLHVPWRLWKVADSNRLLILVSFLFW